MLHLGLVPLDFQRVATLDGGPCIFGQHRDALKDCDHVDDDALDGLGAACMEGMDDSSKARRTGDDRGQHARSANIHRVDRLARRLFRRIDPRRFSANQSELGRILQSLPIRFAANHLVGCVQSPL